MGLRLSDRPISFIFLLFCKNPATFWDVFSLAQNFQLCTYIRITICWNLYGSISSVFFYGNFFIIISDSTFYTKIWATVDMATTACMKEVLMGKLVKVTKLQSVSGESRFLKVVIRVNYLLPSNKKALKSASSYRQIGFSKKK